VNNEDIEHKRSNEMQRSKFGFPGMLPAMVRFFCWRASAVSASNGVFLLEFNNLKFENLTP
jgi:hypothetical protein